MTISRLFLGGAKVMLGVIFYLLILTFLLDPIRQFLFPVDIKAVTEAAMRGIDPPHAYFQPFLTHVVFSPLAICLAVLAVTLLLRPRTPQYAHGLVLGLLPGLFSMAAVVWAWSVMPPDVKGATPLARMLQDGVDWLLMLGGLLLGGLGGAVMEWLLSRKLSGPTTMPAPQAA